MFTLNDRPTHHSSYDDLEMRDASQEQKEISWTAAVVIVVAAIGIAPYNLFQVWRHARGEVHPSISPGDRHG